MRSSFRQRDGLPDQSLNGHPSRTGNDCGEDAQRLTITRHFHQPIRNQVNILAAPLVAISTN